MIRQERPRPQPEPGRGPRRAGSGRARRRWRPPGSCLRRRRRCGRRGDEIGCHQPADPLATAATRATPPPSVAPTQHDRPHAGLVAHGQGQVAEVVAGGAVDPGHDHPVDGRRRPARRPGPRRPPCAAGGSGRPAPSGPRAAAPPAPAPRAARPAGGWRCGRAWTRSSRMRSKLAVPVTASMRRRLAPIELSPRILIGPIVPRARTWVPPHSSTEWWPASTTRTTSPYLSPKKAMAPRSAASSCDVSISPHRLVGQDLLVGQVLDPLQLLGRHRLVVAEVEAQAVGRDERPGLLDVAAEHLAQGPVQQVGAGVVAADGLPAVDVDGGGGLLAGGDLALDHACHVPAQAGQGEGGVERPRRLPVSVVIDAGVAHLAAGLGVERRAVEEHLDGGAVALGDVEHGQDPGLGLGLVVAGELGGPELRRPARGRRCGARRRTLLRRPLRAALAHRAAGGHLRVEAGHVDLDAPLGRHLQGELEGEAEGVVQLEGDLAGQPVPPAASTRASSSSSMAEPDAQRPPEALLLPADHADDEVAAGEQLGVGDAHDLDGGLDQGGQ